MNLSIHADCCWGYEITQQEANMLALIEFARMIAVYEHS